MQRRTFLISGCTTLLLTAITASEARERGSLGFTVFVDVDGSFLRPVLLSARVTKVNPGSAAEKGGLQVDDEILAVQGQRVAGANARRIAALLEVQPGESLRVRVRRADGVEQELTLVAAASKQ